MAYKLGGGGGGGGTYEDYDVGALTSGSSATVTHTAVPLTSQTFKVESQATLPGTSISRQLPNNTYGVPGYILPNVDWFEAGTITWTDDGYDGSYWSGHFSKAASGQLVPGITLKVVGSSTTVVIGNISGDGTTFQSVKVYSSELVTGILEYAQAFVDNTVYSGSLSLNYAYYSGNYVYADSGYDWLAQVVPAFGFDPTPVGTWSYPPRSYAYFSYGAVLLRSFWSKDGGTTWWGWDTGADDWISGMDPTSLSDRTQYGFNYPPGYYTVMQMARNTTWFEPAIGWTSDGFDGTYWTGHFSKAVSGDLVQGCYLKVAGDDSIGIIVSITGDGTAFQNVLCWGTEMSTGTLEFARKWEDMVLSEWTTWVADATSLVPYLWATDFNNAYGISIYGTYLDYLEADFNVVLSVGADTGGYGGGPQITMKRLSTTQFTVKNSLSGGGGSGDIVDLRVRVYVG